MYKLSVYLFKIKSKNEKVLIYSLIKIAVEVLILNNYLFY